MSLSEIRVNTTKTRTGVGTITYTETGPVITGIATASNFKTGSTNVHSTGVELANINTGGSTATFGGPISGTSATFSGNVSIGGTLTYEDVTNIDSVGILTARAGIKVTGGNINIENAAPRIDLTDTSANPDFAITNTDGNFDVTDLTNSATRLRIQSDGTVYFRGSSSSDSHRLQLRVNDTYNEFRGSSSSGTNKGFTFYSSNTNNSEILRITSTGQVGINQATPTADLEVGGRLVGTAATIFINPSSHNTNVASIAMLKLGYKHSGGQAVGYLKLTEGGGNSFDGNLTIGVPYNIGGGSFGTRDAVTIKHSGRVGIGEASPDELLHIASTGTAKFRLTDNRTSISNGSQYGVIQFEQRDSNTPGVSAEVAAVMQDTTNGNTAIQFRTGTPSTIGERLRITGSGKVLIGDGATYSPNGLLHIVGDDNSNGPELYLQVNNNNTTDNIGALWFGNNVDKSLVKLAGHTHSANNTADFTVSTSNAGTLGERLRVDYRGNMGLGTNSPNHYNNYSTITLNGATGGEIDFEDDGTLLGDHFCNVNGHYFTAGRSAAMPFIWQTHNGSSVGQRMQLTSTGQLNIGGALTQTTFQAQITGDLLLQKAAAAYDNPLLELYATNNTAHGGSIKFTGHYGNKYELARIRSYGGGGSPNSSGGSLGFSTGDGNEKLLIQADGNISFRHSNTPTIRIDSGNANNGSCLKVEIDGTEEFRFDPGSLEFKNSSNTSRGTLLGGINYYSNTNLYVDLTQWRLSDNWNVLEVFGYVNPNSSGSGQYTDPLHMYIYRGVGWNGGIKNYIYSVHVAPPARQAFPGGSGMSGNSGVSAVWYHPSSGIVGNESATSTHYIRLVIPNANANANFQKTFRILRRF